MSFDTRHASSRYRYYVLALLTLTYFFSFMDRQIMAILIEDVGAEFALSDAQKGLLMGLAFALFYAGLGVPIAWLADRYNRRNIIAAAVTLWSAATAACSATTGFANLFIARMFVGVGEAGATPPAHSMIADYFPKSQLGRALAVYTLGLSLGGFVGMALGGLIADVVGWRTTFLIFGLPGVGLGALIFFTVKEPLRGAFVEGRGDASDEDQPDNESLGAAIMRLLTFRPYVAIGVGVTLSVFMSYIISSWGAAIMIRNFGMSTSQVGLMMGTAMLIGGTTGAMGGGWLVDKLGATSAKHVAWLGAVAALFAIVTANVAMFSQTPLAMTVTLTIKNVFSTMCLVVAISIIQNVVQTKQRALASSLQMLVANLVGMGAGPFIAGWLSEQLRPTYAEYSLNYAVAYLSVCLVVSAMAYFVCGRALKPGSLAGQASS